MALYFVDNYGKNRKIVEVTQEKSNDSFEICLANEFNKDANNWLADLLAV